MTFDQVTPTENTLHGQLIEGRLLLNAGASEAGFSGISTFKRCPQLYAYRKVLGLDLDDGAPLVKGSLLHIGLAHLYRRIQLALGGGNPDAYHEPLRAVSLLAEDFERGCELPGLQRPPREAAKWVPLIHQTLLDYWTAHMHDRPNILMVEEQIRVGLRWSPRGGRVAEVRLLAPGEPAGPGWRLYTQRLDMVEVGRDGVLEIVDHKSTAYLKAGSDGSVDTYSMHGQFWGAERLGRLRYPEFTRVRVLVNLVEWGKAKRGEEPTSGKLLRAQIPSAPAMLAGFWEDILDWYDWRDRLLAETGGLPDTPAGLDTLAERPRSPWDWPKVGTDTGCRTIYGTCGYRELCRHGKDRLPRLVQELSFRVPEKPR